MEKKTLQELREFLWIDRGTRILIVDLTFYNANINFFSVVKIFFEFPPTGGLLKGIDIRTVKVTTINIYFIQITLTKNDQSIKAIRCQ